MTTESTPDGNGGIDGLVNRMAALLQHRGNVLTTGDVALLRRMDPRHPSSTFFKLEGAVLDAELPGQVDAREDRETRWAAVVVGLAYLGDLHRPERRLGEALADAHFSERRFSRLLRADSEQLADEVPMIARYLHEVTAGQPLQDVPWDRPPGVKATDTGGTLRTTMEEVKADDQPGKKTKG